MMELNDRNEQKISVYRETKVEESRSSFIFTICQEMKETLVNASFYISCRPICLPRSLILTLFIFQLILKSKAANPITLYFLMLRGPFGEMRVQPKIYHFEFAEGTNESQLVLFPLSDSAECNKILSGKSINCRFVSIRKL